MASLRAKNKVKFINGKLPQPDPEDDDYDSWCRCNSMVISSILHAVSRDIADSIMYLDDATTIWNELHDLFHQNNDPHVFQVKPYMKGLARVSNDVTTYIICLKALWNLCKEFRPLHVYSCGAMKTFIEYQQQDLVFEFLVGLNDSYTAIRSQILMQDLLPNINKVYATVIQEG
ncbi:uncharacterized protein LOC133779275 [Humulus lupulus]|uniref:uncharacterized protein LOC133779275 n=1 Tax=Humulus lupulus TaxID=3486 RepID=UPI002B4079A1|nr:uncharacterized protein LOC133779275 [Humulus lupulus]